MIDFPNVASAATCAALAQILPVFIVALVAERIARVRGTDEVRAHARRLLATLIRILIDLALAFALLGLTLLALVGIENEGLTGNSANMLWVGTLVAGIAILYRWVLVSTPFLSLLDELAQGWAQLVLRGVALLAEALPKGMSHLANFVFRFVQLASEIVFGVLGAGLFRGIAAFSDRVVAAWNAPADSPTDRDD